MLLTCMEHEHASFKKALHAGPIIDAVTFKLFERMKRLKVL